MIWLPLILLAVVIAAPFVREAKREVMNKAARNFAPGRFVKLPKGVTHFAWQGPLDGPVLICIHGLTTPSFVWRGMLAGLTDQGFRVLTYDLYGRGFSHRPGGRQDAAFFLRQLNDLLTHQEVRGPVTLVGYSMGGAIATAFAAAHPDRVRQLVLLAPAGMQHKTGKMITFLRDWRVIGDWLMLALYPRMARKSIAAEAHLASSVLDITELQEAELDYKGYIPAILSSLRGILGRAQKKEHLAVAEAGIPAIAIWGSEDNVIPLTACGTLAEWNRDVEQEVIEGAGHGLTYTHTDKVMSFLGKRLIK